MVDLKSGTGSLEIVEEPIPIFEVFVLIGDGKSNDIDIVECCEGTCNTECSLSL